MENEDDIDNSLEGGVTKRACEACRSRKVRCDRAVPCSNCKAAGITCTTSSPTQRVQAQRIHVTKKYEVKIDRIEDRLSNIEQALKSLTSKLDNLGTGNDFLDPGSHNRIANGTKRSPASIADTPSISPFEGETAIHSQSNYARELLAMAVGTTPSIGQNASIQSALDALKHLVSRQNNAVPVKSRNYASLYVDTSKEKLELPPWEVVTELLDDIAKYSTMAITIIYPFLGMKNLKNIIQDVYENPEECGAPRRLLAYGALFNLILGCGAFPDEMTDVQACKQYATVCQEKVEVAMSQLDIYMPANHENIMALLAGAISTIETCKPSLSWMMISTAAGLCQELGYHRITSMKLDTPEDKSAKIQAFWIIYTLDKTLSLRHGRASVIQDWDISLPFRISGEEMGEDKDFAILAYWIKVARVQGQTYEKLFSPAGFLQMHEERARIAADLVHQLEQAWTERGETKLFSSSNFHQRRMSQHAAKNPNDTKLPSQRGKKAQNPLPAPRGAARSLEELYEYVDDMMFHTDAVLHYSTCALIQRAASLDKVTFNDECLESSRAALVAHMRCNEQFNTEGNEELWAGYMNWSVIHAPFTPFIVLFCNLIQNTNTEDLTSLTHFVDSLETCRAISEGADNLYKICHLFLQIAKLYIQAKKQEALALPLHHEGDSYDQDFDTSAIAEFDPYLSALGLAPNSTFSIDGLAATSTLPGIEIFNSHENIVNSDIRDFSAGWPDETQKTAQNWFWGSRYLMNLMEAGSDDLPMPNLEF